MSVLYDGRATCRYPGLQEVRDVPGKDGIAFVEFEDETQVQNTFVLHTCCRFPALFELCDSLKNSTAHDRAALQATVAMNGLQGFKVTAEDHIRLTYAKK